MILVQTYLEYSIRSSQQCILSSNNQNIISIMCVCLFIKNSFKCGKTLVFNKSRFHVTMIID